MNAPSVELARMERLRQRFGFWVDLLRIRQIFNRLLTWVPLYRGAAGDRVRMQCWSDLLAYNEIFRAGIYDVVFDDHPVATFCDLGSQSGMALLRLASRSGAPQHALLVDGNPHAVERCRRNMYAAGLGDAVRVVHGAVGCADPGSGTTGFVLRENELECALAAGQGTERAKTVEVPVISLDKAWLEYAGDVPCDLLKMDIEGAELDVLRNDRAFLSRVHAIVLEWHDPPAARAVVIEMLRSLGFADVRVLCEGIRSGVVFSRRTAPAANGPVA
jgi:FkbM family methyltransferase